MSSMPVHRGNFPEKAEADQLIEQLLFAFDLAEVLGHDDCQDPDVRDAAVAHVMSRAPFAALFIRDGSEG
ncbi:MAG: hypothetical protein GF320_21955 [Armatimonadia bacterium]|nr:hypothetical protein [Armatimonadia bacterium]